MDFELLLNRHDYRDIDESDSESEYHGPDLFEPLDSGSTLSSPYITPQRSLSPPPIEPLPSGLSNAPLRAILPGDKPPPIAPPKKSFYTVGARIQALTLYENGIPIDKITAKTGIAGSSVYQIRTKACLRG
jgi:hypothetical protein